MEAEILTRMQVIERRQRLYLTAILILAFCVAGLIGYLAYLNQLAKTPQSLRVRQLTVVDDHGTDRAILGAPLPEPIVLGQRRKRGGSASGLLIFDAAGNERGGYVTDDQGGNAMLTLDNEKTQSVLLLVEPEGDVSFKLWNDKASVLMGVRDNTFLNLREAETNVRRASGQPTKRRPSLILQRLIIPSSWDRLGN